MGHRLVDYIAARSRQFEIRQGNCRCENPLLRRVEPVPRYLGEDEGWRGDVARYSMNTNDENDEKIDTRFDKMMKMSNEARE